MHIKGLIPLFIGTVTMFIYAFVIVMLKQFSSKYSPFALLTSYLPIQVVIVFAMSATVALWQPLGMKVGVFPPVAEWHLVALLALLFTLGSTCNYMAYRTGGSVAMMSALTILLPVFTSLIVVFTSGERPTFWQLCAYAFGAMMIFCVVKD